MILKLNSILLFNMYVTDPFCSNLNFHISFQFKHFLIFLCKIIRRNLVCIIDSALLLCCMKGFFFFVNETLSDHNYPNLRLTGQYKQEQNDSPYYPRLQLSAIKRARAVSS